MKAKIWLAFAILLFLFATQNSFAQTDEFKPAGSEFSGQEQKKSGADEFKSTDEFKNSGDEFKPATDSSLSGGNAACGACPYAEECAKVDAANKKTLYWSIAVLLATILAGIFVRFKVLRNFRALFLIASVVILGFYNGACPCHISSLENLVLFAVGVPVAWQSFIWFLGLLVVTYLFGKTFCGWICHMGALQEFLYRPASFKVLQTQKAQKILRYIRIALLVVLVVQLAITKTLEWCHIDPFKAAYNLFTVSTVSWVLLGLLVVSSIFIYRPFCKTACPIGLILGWITKIPGASILGTVGACSGCKICNSECEIRAITRDDKYSTLDNQECIACGNCLGGCKLGVLDFVRKSKNNSSVVECKNECKTK